MLGKLIPESGKITTSFCPLDFFSNPESTVSEDQRELGGRNGNVFSLECGKCLSNFAGQLLPGMKNIKIERTPAEFPDQCASPNSRIFVLKTNMNVTYTWEQQPDFWGYRRTR